MFSNHRTALAPSPPTQQSEPHCSRSCAFLLPFTENEPKPRDRSNRRETQTSIHSSENRQGDSDLLTSTHRPRPRQESRATQVWQLRDENTKLALDIRLKEIHLYTSFQVTSPLRLVRSESTQTSRTLRNPKLGQPTWRVHK